MSSDEVLDLGAAELVALYRRKALSPVEVVEVTLKQIERFDPVLNATIKVLAEPALAQAARLERRIVAGDPLGALVGVPVGLKDVIATADTETTGGSSIYRDFVPRRDAAVVKRLRDEDAIFVAKLNTLEFSHGGGWNAHFGGVRNPWNTDYFAGGSSSGAGASVSARMMPVAIGADTGGSVRVPAANCGIVGLKPTYGRVPRTGVMPCAWSLDHIGTLTRTVADAALVLGVIAGYDEGDTTSSLRSVPDYTKELRFPDGLRIGVPNQWFFDEDGVDQQASAKVEEALTVFEEAGAAIEHVDLPTFELTSAIVWTIMAAEYSSLHQATMARIEEVDPVNAIRMEMGDFVSALDYLKAQRVRHLMQKECEVAFEQVDVLVTPGSAGAAARFIERVAGSEPVIDINGSTHSWLASSRVTGPFNLTGMPAVVVPCGFNSQSLPLSLQVAAPPHADALALAVAGTYAERTGFAAHRPRILTENA